MIFLLKRLYFCNQSSYYFSYISVDNVRFVAIELENMFWLLSESKLSLVSHADCPLFIVGQN